MKGSIKAIGTCLSLLLLLPVSTQAATTNITGGTNGASCNSGGYFTPSSVIVNEGDTITFTVPSDDPYAGGLQIHGFPQGNFTIARGASKTTSPLHVASVSFYGSWPNTGCTKGSGTVTINLNPVTPAPTPTPTSTTPLSGSGSSSSSSSGGTSTKAKTATPATKTAPPSSTSTTPVPAASQPTSSNSSNTVNPVDDNVSTDLPLKAPTSKTPLLAGVTASLAIVGVGVWWLLHKGYLHKKSSGKKSAPLK